MEDFVDVPDEWVRSVLDRAPALTDAQIRRFIDIFDGPTVLPPEEGVA